MPAPPRGRRALRGPSGGGALGRRARGRGVAERREEECLVDSALEDRDAQLHALLDHVAPVKAGLARELGGRQMICHWAFPPGRLRRWAHIARLPDGVKPRGSGGYTGFGRSTKT